MELEKGMFPNTYIACGKVDFISVFFHYRFITLLTFSENKQQEI